MAKRRKPKGRARKGKGLISRIRSMIRESSDSPTGTGGARRGRDIDDAVDAMQSGIDEARNR